MRILIVNSEYPPIGGGAGNASANLASELMAVGQDMTVITAHYGDLPLDTRQDGIHIKRVRSLRRRVDRSGALEQVAFLLAGSLGALSLIRRWRPDVVIAFFGVPGGAIAWLVKKLTGIPYLVSLRGGDVPGFRPYDFAFYHRLVGPFLRIIWHQAGAVVANSKGLRLLATKFESRQSIQIIPNGVDLQRFNLPEKRNWDHPRMLLTGRLVYQKGVDVLLQALSALQHLPWSLSLVGDGPHRPELESLAVEYGIRERISFTGWLDGIELAKQYQSANLFVFPSRHEGMPNAVLEAMASGLPVIASQIAGSEELVLPDETGLLVPADDVDALRSALQSLLPQPSRRKRMGAAGRQRVEQHFTWTQVARQYLAMLQEMV
jgi:glycosyltransferase involved in cell wall biosynthesis